MLNARTLFPPLFRPVDSGGSGSVREKIAEIDSQITRIDSQITDISGDITQIDSVITRLSNNVGDLSQLDTTDKSSLVGAVNEVAGSGGGYDISTTETDTGLKYNNKSVYVKAYPNGAISKPSELGTGPFALVSGVTGIDDLLYGILNVKYPNSGTDTHKGMKIPLPIHLAHTIYNELYYLGDSSITLSAFSSTDCTLIVYYTKTS